MKRQSPFRTGGTDWLIAHADWAGSADKGSGMGDGDRDRPARASKPAAARKRASQPPDGDTASGEPEVFT